MYTLGPTDNVMANFTAAKVNDIFILQSGTYYYIFIKKKKEKKKIEPILLSSISFL